MRTCRTWLVLAVLWASASGVLAEGAGPLETEAGVAGLLAEGRDLYAQDRLDEAFAKFEEMLKIDEDNRPARHYIARIHARSGRYKQAIDFIRQLQQLGVSITRSKDSEITLNLVMGGILGLPFQGAPDEEKKRRADLLVHLRETIHGLTVRVEHQIDAHLMSIYAEMGEMHLHQVVKARYFRNKPVSPEAYFTVARTYLGYNVLLPEAAAYFEQAIEALKARQFRPSGNPELDRFRHKLINAQRTIYQDFLAYTYHAAGILDPEKNLLLAAEPVPAATFTNVTEAAGFQGIRGARVAVGDFDDDGFEDACVNGRVFKNNQGANFTDVTEQARIEPGDTTAALWLDYDNDGRLDLLCAALPKLRLWRNLGNGTFVDSTGKAGLGLPLPGSPEALAAADYDGDGYLDLFVGCFENPKEIAVGQRDFLFRNTGTGQFLDVSQTAGLRPKRKVTNPETGKEEMREVAYCARGCAWGDFNGDGFIDLYVANYRLDPNQLWVNQGNGTFVDRAEELGVLGTPGRARVRGRAERVLVPSFGHSIGCAWGDLDNDGDLDLVVSNLASREHLQYADVSAVYINSGQNGNWHFGDVFEACGMRYEEMTADTSVCDFDNDGDLDVYFTAIFRERPSFLYQNVGQNKFQAVSWRSGAIVFSSWGQAWFDKDNDGDMDLLTGGAGTVRLLENQAKGTSWLRVRLVGKLSNRFGVGARVTVAVGPVQLVREVTCGSGSTSQSSSILHFGLGEQKGPVQLTVRWPDGHTQRLADVTLNQLLRVEEK